MYSCLVCSCFLVDICHLTKRSFTWNCLFCSRKGQDCNSRSRLNWGGKLRGEISKRAALTMSTYSHWNFFMCGKHLLNSFQFTLKTAFFFFNPSNSRWQCICVALHRNTNVALWDLSIIRLVNLTLPKLLICMWSMFYPVDGKNWFGTQLPSCEWITGSKSLLL